LLSQDLQNSPKKEKNIPNTHKEENKNSQLSERVKDLHAFELHRRTSFMHVSSRVCNGQQLGTKLSSCQVLVEISVSSNATSSITAHELCNRKVCICLTL
jgi:hypothetical protein